MTLAPLFYQISSVPVEGGLPSPSKPVLSVVNDGTGNSVTIIITSDVAVNNQIKYKQDGGSLWLDGVSVLGSNSVQQTGLIKNRKYTFICVSDNGINFSLPSNPKDIFVATEGDGYASGSAKILKSSLLNKIVKRSTASSKEFQITNGFILVENKDISENDSDYNPFTEEDNDETTHSSSLFFETVFTGEIDIVSKFDLLRNTGGNLESGDIIITLDIEEVELKGLSIDRIERAYGVKVLEPQFVNKKGVVLSVDADIYKIKSVVPQMIQNRMTDIEISLYKEAIQNDEKS